MRWRPRFSIGALLILIAVVAIAFAARNDWHFRQRRNRCAQIRLNLLAEAKRQRNEQQICLENESHQIPYDFNRDEFCDGIRKHLNSPHPYMGWLDEAEDHAAGAAQALNDAEKFAREQSAAESHLIFP